jgi:hypothetical protein
VPGTFFASGNAGADVKDPFLIQILAPPDRVLRFVKEKALST